MTVQKLHRALEALIAKGHARKPVCVNKRSFTHPLEPDGVAILDVTGLHYEAVVQADNDGGTGENKDGTEPMRRCVVLTGETP